MPDTIIASPAGWLVAIPAWPTDTRNSVKLITYCVIGWRIAESTAPVPIMADGEPVGVWLVVAPDGWVTGPDRLYSSLEEAEVELKQEWEEGQHRES